RAGGHGGTVGRFIGQRRTAVGAEAALHQVRRLEVPGRATCPGELHATDRHQRGVMATEGFLAHAAMADRAFGDLAAHLEADGTALAAAAVFGLTLHGASLGMPASGRHPSGLWTATRPPSVLLLAAPGRLATLRQRR